MTDRARLDEIDKKILSILQRDGRITNQDLAQRVGLSASPCLQRVRKLEKQGYIESYLARIQLDELTRSVTVFATLTLKSHEKKDFDRFEAAVREMREVVWCYKVSGAFDYLLRFVCTDMAAYRVRSDELLGLGGVEKISSHVALDAIKEFVGYDLEQLLE
jgi:DNA-binding Lrp family transcriptional regulator